MFKVIDGKKDEHQKPTKEWYIHKYAEMADKHYATYREHRDRYSLAAYCLCYVRFFNLAAQADGALAKDVFHGASAGKDVMSLLTPREFLRTFPPKKSYDGNTWGCIDYFSTMEKFKDLPMDEPINTSGVDMLEFICGYSNDDVLEFNANCMLAVSRLHEAETGKDLFDSFLESQGKPPLKKYYMHTDEKGRQYMVDEDGKSQRVHKPKPRYIHVVK